MANVAIIFYSAQGHTKQVADAAAEGARGVAGTTVEAIRIVDTDIAGGRYKNDDTFAKLAKADAIIFGTPTYMGGYSAQMKAFIDAASAVWFVQGWKGKLGAAFTHSQGLSGDKLNTLNGLYINAMQHGMLWIGPGLMVEGVDHANVNRLSSFSGVMAQTNYGVEKVPDGDLKTARLLGQRVAETAAKLAGK